MIFEIGQRFTHASWIKGPKDATKVECEIVSFDERRKLVRYRSLNDSRIGQCRLSELPNQIHSSLRAEYADEVKPEQVRAVDELLREEFRSGEWVTVEAENSR